MNSAILPGNLRIPVIAAPMFIISSPALVIAACTAGIVSVFPTLNARTTEELDQWLTEITQALRVEREQNPQKVIGPFGVNIMMAHPRTPEDVKVVEKHAVPFAITSLGHPAQFIQVAHQWGGIVFHDAISLYHAQKAIEAGADGIIAVASGAGGHAGTINPIALIGELRAVWSGPLVLAGCITTGRDILVAQAMGADYAYIGTRFIATHEARASLEYKNMLLEATAKDIVYTKYCTGISGNYLQQSLQNCGFDPENMPSSPKNPAKVSQPVGATTNLEPAKAWKDIWSGGQGVGRIHKICGVQELVDTLVDEYEAATTSLLHQIRRQH